MKSLYHIAVLAIYTIALTPSLLGQCTCTDCPLDMPDGFQGDLFINVSGAANDNLSSGGQGVCGISMDFTHEYIGDMVMTLTSPAGETVTLIGPADLSGATDNTTWLVDFVECSPDATAVPDAGFPAVWDNTLSWGTNNSFTGSYFPSVGCLQDFNMGSVNGTWTITIDDQQGIDAGVFNNFTITFCNNNGVDCNLASCTASAGTNSGVVTGASTSTGLDGNGYVLCNDDEVDITSNDDFILPDPSGVDPAGLGFAIYNCPPTTDDPDTDPCWTGYYWTGDDFSDMNDFNGDASDNIDMYDFISTNPSGGAGVNGEPTGGNLYFAPITMDDICPGTTAGCDPGLGHDLDNDGCFDLGAAVEIVYLDPIIFPYSVNCAGNGVIGDVAVTIDGGWSGFSGSTPIITGVSPASFSQSGNVVTFTGLSGGDNITFTVSDQYGCDATFNSGPLPACLDCTCANCPLAMPDGFEDDFFLTISGADNNDLSTATQGVCGVNLEFDHEYLGDLEITLISPGGQVITLIGAVGLFGLTDGASWNVNFVPCASAASPDASITSSTWDNDDGWDINGTYTGTYYPSVGCLEDFNTGSVNGTWTIHVLDDQGIDMGNFTNFSIEFCDPTSSSSGTGVVDCSASDCVAEPGATSGVQTGEGTNSIGNFHYLLCDGDQIDITTGGYTLPPAGCANCIPEIIYHFYSCPPDPAGLLEADPCWENFVSEDVLNNGNFLGQTNNGGSAGGIGPLLDANNNLWIQIVTGDDGDDDASPNVFHDQDGDGCFEVGNTIQLTYFNPIEFSFTTSCDPSTGLGSVDVTVTGGYP